MNTDTTHLPDLRKINQRLALNSVHVETFLRGLMPRVDALVQAATDRNWPEVGRISYIVHRCCDVYGYEELAHHAGEICEANAAREPETLIQRKIVAMLGALSRVSGTEDLNKMTTTWKPVDSETQQSTEMV